MTETIIKSKENKFFAVCNTDKGLLSLFFFNLLKTEEQRPPNPTVKQEMKETTVDPPQ